MTTKGFILQTARQAKRKGWDEETAIERVGQFKEQRHLKMFVAEFRRYTPRGVAA